MCKGCRLAKVPFAANLSIILYLKPLRDINLPEYSISQIISAAVIEKCREGNVSKHSVIKDEKCGNKKSIYASNKNGDTTLATKDA